MNPNPTYRQSIKILKNKFISCYIYHMNPGGVEQKHYLDGLEIEYVLKGNCRTHKQWKLYFRKRGEIHEGINDSDHELIFLNITIPSESSDNTHYLK